MDHYGIRAEQMAREIERERMTRRMQRIGPLLADLPHTPSPAARLLARVWCWVQGLVGWGETAPVELGLSAVPRRAIVRVVYRTRHPEPSCRVRRWRSAVRCSSRRGDGRVLEPEC